MLKLFFDGGCRPNPGMMEAAVVVRGVTHHWSASGHGDNNDAEWQALIHAVTLARALDARDVMLIGDSALVINQAKRLQPCRSARMGAHLQAFDTLATAFDRLRLRQVARSHNLAGIALDKIGAGLSDPT